MGYNEVCISKVPGRKFYFRIEFQGLRIVDYITEGPIYDAVCDGDVEYDDIFNELNTKYGIDIKGKYSLLDIKYDF